MPRVSCQVDEGEGWPLCSNYLAKSKLQRVRTQASSYAESASGKEGCPCRHLPISESVEARGVDDRDEGLDSGDDNLDDDKREARAGLPERRF
jgi:hypothetical protein